ncbi:hypothetical protein SAY86_031987 [Trapa natans]|uniref:Uncharacterized protein n=1 Tax=Trapa natans TaxID=22666 RepID=A0AAN7LTP7_TRANT|nr:hypothetical protein SAY86_031987 [Trapa natans]
MRDFTCFEAAPEEENYLGSSESSDGHRTEAIKGKHFKAPTLRAHSRSFSFSLFSSLIVKFRTKSCVSEILRYPPPLGITPASQSIEGELFGAIFVDFECLDLWILLLEVNSLL